jgi:hypothetical protein
VVSGATCYVCALSFPLPYIKSDVRNGDIKRGVRGFERGEANEKSTRGKA